jgi:hypothetical protein
VTIQEERLRDLLHRAAPEPTVAIDYEAIGLNVRRRHRAKMLISAIIVVVVVGAVGAAFAAVSGDGTDGEQRITATPGPVAGSRDWQAEVSLSTVDQPIPYPGGSGTNIVTHAVLTGALLDAQNRALPGTSFHEDCSSFLSHAPGRAPETCQVTVDDGQSQYTASETSLTGLFSTFKRLVGGQPAGTIKITQLQQKHVAGGTTYLIGISVRPAATPSTAKASCRPIDTIGVYPSHAPGPGVTRQVLTKPIVIPITHVGRIDKVVPLPTVHAGFNAFSSGFRVECGTAQFSSQKLGPEDGPADSVVLGIHMVVTSYTGTPSLVVLNAQVEDEGEVPPSSAPVRATPAAQEPGWLPPGAKLIAQTTTGTNNKGVLLIYTLSGAANANPSAQLQVSSIPDIVNPPAPFTDPKAGIVGESVTVSGVPATLVHPSNGLGTWRVTWLTGTTYHSVSDEHLQTPQGISGITADELLRVANSIAQ